jgi:hypothetical protein
MTHFILLHPNQLPSIQHRGLCDRATEGTSNSRQQVLESQQPHKTHARGVPSNLRTTSKMLSSLGNPRQAAAQLMNFGLILSTAFMVRCPPMTQHDLNTGLPLACC